MPRISVTNTIKEVFNKNPKKEFTVEEMVKTLDECYALVPKSPQGSVSALLQQLTRRGILVRRKNGKGVYAYRKRGSS